MHIYVKTYGKRRFKHSLRNSVCFIQSKIIVVAFGSDNFLSCGTICSGL